MAVVGCLGDVVFTVSRKTVMTLDNIQWNSGSKWEEHARHLKDPALEYTGMEADQMSFDIYMSKNLGVDPMKQIVTLFKYERNGTLLPLIIGTKAYGKYRWVIMSTTRKFEQTDPSGLTSVTVGLTLKAYTE